MSKLKKGRNQQSVSDLQASIQRDIDRGDFKEALKNARVLCRRFPGQHSRQLLQRASVARAEQLHQNRLLEQAREALKDLAGPDPLPDDLVRRATRLRVLLGMADGTTNGGSRNEPADPALQTELADQAVLHGASPSCPAELRRQAEQIRSALEQVAAGGGGYQAYSLPEIDRRSPLSDWKLFVRGLAAYYEQDDPRAIANWQRLAASRPPHRIAQTLLLAAGLVGEKDVDADNRVKAKELASAMNGHTLGADLRTFKRLWDHQEWSPLIRQYGKLAGRYGQSHPDVVQRLADVLWRRLLREERLSQVRKLLRTCPGPPMDPKFHRVRALLAEREGELGRAERAWIDFIRDLEQCTVLQERDRALAVGLVYQRLGESAAEAAADCRMPQADGWLDDLPDEDLCFAELTEKAIAFYERSLEKAPAHRETYLEYAKTLKALEADPGVLRRLYSRLLAQFPEDVDALLTVAEHHLDYEEPDLAMKHARLAHRLRPRDERVLTTIWRAALATSRLAARGKEFALARMELDGAQAYVGSGREQYLLDACRAAVEFKAGDLDAAEQFVQATLGHFDEPAVGLLIVSAQAFRIGVSTAVRRDLNARLKEALKHARKSSAAAGTLARFLFAYQQTDTTYHGIGKHTQMVARYVKGCRHESWQPNDLIAVCHFLTYLDTPVEAFRRMVQRGLRLFPQEPYFHFYSGEIEMASGPFACDRPRARAAFERAIELSKTAERPLDELHRTQASKALVLLQGPPPTPMHIDYGDDEFENDEDGPLYDFGDVDPSQLSLDELIDTLPPDVRRRLEQLRPEVREGLLEAISSMFNTVET